MRVAAEQTGRWRSCAVFKAEKNIHVHQIKETLKRKETTFNTSHQLLALLAF